MGTLQKSDLIYAFRKKNTKRRDMVVRYYQAWFDEPYTAEVLAQKISDDLGISVDRNLIYQIRSKQRRRQNGRMGSDFNRLIRPSNGADKTPFIQIPDLEEAANKPTSLLTFL